jgi:DNA-binding transcriptional LysR family regulator
MAVQLTDAGLKLKLFAERYLDQLDELFDGLHSEGQDLKGLVRYAMPDSCLMTPHFSPLLQKRKSFLNINLRLTLCDSQTVTEMLLKSEIDFGFITTRTQDVLFNSWRVNYFAKNHNLQLSDLNVCGEINSLSGAITMALHGVGLGVFPKHCVATQLRKKELFTFQSGEDKPTDHPIYIIHSADKYPTARVRRVLDVFWAMKN